VYTNTPIISGKTLLFFDELQAYAEYVSVPEREEQAGWNSLPVGKLFGLPPIVV